MQNQANHWFVCADFDQSLSPVWNTAKLAETPVFKGMEFHFLRLKKQIDQKLRSTVVQSHPM